MISSHIFMMTDKEKGWEVAKGPGGDEEGAS